MVHGKWRLRKLWVGDAAATAEVSAAAALEVPAVSGAGATAGCPHGN